MPDRSGRVTGEDFLGLAKGIREMGKASDEYEEKRGMSLGLDALTADPNAAKPEGISGPAWVKAQEEFGKGQKGLYTARESAEAAKRAKYRDEFTQKLGEGETPEDRLRVLQSINPKDFAGSQALAEVYGHVNQQSEYASALFKRDLEDGALRFSNMQPMLSEARRLLAAKDAAGAGVMLEGMSKQARTRDNWKFNPETGLMDEYHNSREDGLVHTGTSMPVEEVLGLAGKMTQKDYALYEAKNKAATREYNAKAILSGGYLATGSKGEDLRVIPQVRMDDFSGRDFLVFDKHGQHVGAYDEKSFLDSGIMVDKTQKLYMGRSGSGGKGKSGKPLIDEALGIREKAKQRLAKMDPLADPEDLDAGADAETLGYYERKFGRKVTWDELRSMGQGSAPKAGGPAPGGQTLDSTPPVSAFQGLKPGQTRNFRNSETGEVQTWTVDPVSKQPVRVNNSAKKGGGYGLGSGLGVAG